MTITEKIEDIIKKATITYEESDLIIKIMEILLYEDIKDNDLLMLNKSVGFTNMLKVYELFENKKKVFPDINKLKNILILSMIYYYKEVFVDFNNYKKGKSWEEIKELLPTIDIEFYKARYLPVKTKVKNMMEKLLKGELK